MKAENHSAGQLGITVLEYTSVRADESDDMRNCTSAAKFERDLRELLRSGYVSLSIRDYIAVRNGTVPCPQKAFVLTLQGGYRNNYTVAFPILKRLHVFAAFFAATELVGATTHPKAPIMAPHYSWDEAQEMIDSGLVNVYPYWHPFDDGKDVSEEVRNKIQLLQTHLHGNGPICAFAFRRFNEETLQILEENGIEVNLTDFERLPVRLIGGCAVPAVDVNFDADVLDQVEWYSAKAEDALVKSGQLPGEYAESVQKCCSVPKTGLPDESFSLPIDHKPMVRNYLRHAYPFSILQASRMDKAERILLNEYIDLVYFPSFDWLDFHNDLYDAWNQFAIRVMTKDLLAVNGLNVISYLLNALKIGYYCEIWPDTYYIRGKPGYHRTHMTHGLLLYGYDAEKRCFIALSYTARGLYNTLLVPLKQVAEGCASPYCGGMTLLRAQAGTKVPYSFREICEKLLDYLHSVCHDDGHRYSVPSANQFVQYNAALQFASLFKGKALGKGTIPEIPVYSFGEHKRLMIWRLRKLAELENLSVPGLDAAEKEMEKDAKWMVNASMKYNMTHDEAVLDAIVHRLECQNEREKQVLERFLSVAGYADRI